MARVILHSGKPESVLLKDRVPVSAERVDEFLTLLHKADFWNSATEEKRDKGPLLGGIHWVLEGARNREYQVMDRLSPKGSDFVRSCIFLMALIPINLDERGEKQSRSSHLISVGISPEESTACERRGMRPFGPAAVLDRQRLFGRAFRRLGLPPIVRDPSRVDAERGDHSPHADL